MPNELSESPARSLRQAHASLLEDLRKLEDAAQASGAKPEDLRACLLATQAHVTEHFRFEEQDGYFAAVRKRAPHAHRTIQELAEDHRRLAGALQGLIQESTAPIVAEPLRKRIAEWVLWVRDHEARENKLVQEVFNRDFEAED